MLDPVALILHPPPSTFALALSETFSLPLA